MNLVLKGVTWASAMGAALTARLQGKAAFREYCERVSYGEGIGEEDEARGLAHFEQLRGDTLEAQRPEQHRGGAGPSFDRYSWVAPVESREVLKQGGAWFLSLPGLAEPIEVEQAMVAALERLLAFRESFSWSDGLTVARELQATGLYNLLSDLVALGVLQRVDPLPAAEAG